MPQGHNHHDRGALHADCPACSVVANMLSDAGIDPAQVRDLRREPVVTNVFTPDPSEFYRRVRAQRSPILNDRISLEWTADDESSARADIAGEEMGNKASIDADRPYTAEIDWVTDLLYKIEGHTIGYGQAALYSHLYRDHDLLRPPLDIPLRSLQEVHAGSHLLHQGHGGDPEHMIERISREALRIRKRLLEQKRWSALNTELKAEQHARRERTARESREAVMVESARSLKRAIEHTKGTVLPRAQFEAMNAWEVSIKVGVKDRVTVATASIGNDVAIGAAICHPTDRFDPAIGEQLAIARALVALGSVHELEWMTRVSEHNA